MNRGVIAMGLAISLVTPLAVAAEPDEPDLNWRCQVSFSKDRDKRPRQTATVFTTAKAKHLAEKDVADKYVENGNQYVDVVCTEEVPDSQR